VVRDRAGQDVVAIWRTQAAALAHFRDAVSEAAGALNPSAAIGCRVFRDALRTVLASDTLRIVDHRRDVVHVIDAIEARQWRVPVVFACGLLEGQFPKHHAEDAILPDPVRRRLQDAGVPVKTSDERQAEEKLLFDMVLTRATEKLILSYGRLNGRGEPNLPSFLLPRAAPYEEEPAAVIRPMPIAHCIAPFRVASRRAIGRASRRSNRQTRQCGAECARVVPAVPFSVFRRQDAAAVRASVRSVVAAGSARAGNARAPRAGAPFS
jgi:hypothetical protein